MTDLSAYDQLSVTRTDLPPLDTPTISEEADRSGECYLCLGQAPRLYDWEEELICELCYEDIEDPSTLIGVIAHRLR